MGELLRIFAYSIEQETLDPKIKNEISSFLKNYHKSENFNQMIVGLQEDQKANLLNSIR